MLDRMAVHPCRSGGTAARPISAVTLVEALAYAADHASYYQGRRGDPRLICRWRGCGRRSAGMPGCWAIARSEGTNARLWVAIDVDAPEPGTAEAPALPAGSLVLTRPETPSAAAGLPPGLPIDQELPPRRARADAGRAPRCFGDPGAARIAEPAAQRHGLPTAGGTGTAACPPAARSPILVGSNADLGLAAGDVLILEERGTPTAPADAGRRHCGAAGRVAARRRRPAGGDSPSFEIRWGPDDALPFPLILNGADGRTAVRARATWFWPTMAGPSTMSTPIPNRQASWRTRPHAALAGQGRTGLEPLAPSGAGGGPRARLTDGPVGPCRPL